MKIRRSSPAVMTQLYDRTVDAVRVFYDWRISGPALLSLDEHFPRAHKFVCDWRAIKDEALAVSLNLQDVPRFHEIMPEQASISNNDGRDWRMFILKAYGAEQPRNMHVCPRLTALVKAEPQILSASFSFLGPRKHIPAHRGPFKGIIRFYLVLSMPHRDDGKPACVLKIADIEHRLEEGDFLLWDDTFTHEAWNESDVARIVLSLDVWRPRMPMDLRILSTVIVGIIRLCIRLRSGVK